MSPKQLPANDKDDDNDDDVGDGDDDDDDDDDDDVDEDDCNHDDDDVDLGQVVVLADPFNCNALAVQVAHHPHCPTDHDDDDFINMMMMVL